LKHKVSIRYHRVLKENSNHNINARLHFCYSLLKYGFVHFSVVVCKIRIVSFYIVLNELFTEA